MYTPCMLCGLLPFIILFRAYLSKKKNIVKQTLFRLEAVVASWDGIKMEFMEKICNLIVEVN